jgi:hypothetical protein
MNWCKQLLSFRSRGSLIDSSLEVVIRSLSTPEPAIGIRVELERGTRKENLV